MEARQQVTFCQKKAYGKQALFLRTFLFSY